MNVFLNFVLFFNETVNSAITNEFLKTMVASTIDLQEWGFVVEESITCINHFLQEGDLVKSITSDKKVFTYMLKEYQIKGSMFILITDVGIPDS